MDFKILSHFFPLIYNCTLWDVLFLKKISGLAHVFFWYTSEHHRRPHSPAKKWHFWPETWSLCPVGLCWLEGTWSAEWHKSLPSDTGTMRSARKVADISAGMARASEMKTTKTNISSWTDGRRNDEVLSSPFVKFVHFCGHPSVMSCHFSLSSNHSTKWLKPTVDHPKSQLEWRLKNRICRTCKIRLLAYKFQQQGKGWWSQLVSAAPMWPNAC